MFPELDLSFESRLTKSTAGQIAKIISSENCEQLLERWSHFYKRCPIKASNPCEYEMPKTEPTALRGHSDSMAVIDKDGNAVALVHSINSLEFGNGMFVGGASLSDATAANLGALNAAEAGTQIANPLEPGAITLIVSPLLL